MHTKNSPKKLVPLFGLRLLFIAILVIPLLLANTGFAAASGKQGAVYVMTNSASGNEILAFDRDSDGSLTEAGAFSTGGDGSGAGLGSQGALVLSKDRRWLVAVNAGSDEISSFAVKSNGLELVDTVDSGGDMPISVTIHGRLVYVLNAGDSGNVSGFFLSPNGNLSPIPQSTKPLSNGGSGAAPGPAQIEFTPLGESVVVTEKATNQILTYRLSFNGRLSDPEVHPSSGETPFGFAFGRRGQLFVSEAFGGAADQSAVSSYFVFGNKLKVISPSVTTHQTAACWVVVTRNGRYAYSTNTGSGSISGYRIRLNGHISLLDDDGRTGVTGDGSTPIDMALSRDSKFLYALASGTDRIEAFQVNSDGSLDPIDSAELPDGVVGMAAY